MEIPLNGTKKCRSTPLMIFVIITSLYFWVTKIWCVCSSPVCMKVCDGLTDQTVVVVSSSNSILSQIIKVSVNFEQFYLSIILPRRFRSAT